MSTDIFQKLLKKDEKILFGVNQLLHVFIFILTFTLFLTSILLTDGQIHAETIECTEEKSCNGTAKSDVIVGNRLANKINGLAGADYIIGLAGNDNLIGGNGTDFIFGGQGTDMIRGGGDRDAIMGGTGNDYIAGGFGADDILGGEGNDTILGESGPDIILGGPNDDIIIGGYGTDTLDGNDGNDLIYSTDPYTTYSDNSTDNIKCGEGKDEVWINTSIDADEVSSDCEIIHEG